MFGQDLECKVLPKMTDCFNLLCKLESKCSTGSRVFLFSTKLLKASQR